MIVYESTVILSPELPAEKTEEFVEKIKKLVDTAKGKILLTQQLGRKKLAYPIKKYREGNYIYFEISGPGSVIAALENLFKVTDSVVRYLTIKVDKKPGIPKPAEQPKTVEQAVPAQVQEEVKPNEQLQSSTAGAE